MVILFLVEFIPSVLSYIFLILVSNYTNANIIGIMGFIITFSTLLANISNIEIHVGMKRYLGKSVSENHWSNFKQISSASTLFVLFTSILILLIFLNPFVNFLELFDINDVFIPIISIIVIGNNLNKIFIGIFSSALRTTSLILPSIISSVLRFLPLLFFIYVDDLTEISIFWSYNIFYIGIIISSLIAISSFFMKLDGKSLKNIIFNIKLVIKGSLASWTTGLISTIGTKLNILVIFSTHGASDSGLFFIPWIIFMALMMLVNAITQIIHPIFSGFEDSDQQLILLRRTMKLGFLTTIPIFSIVYFYSESVLAILGPEFIIANDTFTILLVSFPLMVFNDVVFYLFYARGKYNYVFYIGLITNIPRILLYFVLIPEFGNIGAAWAFTIGTFFQTSITFFLIRKSKISLQYFNYLILIFIPLLIGYIFDQINLGILGIIIIFIISYIVFLKLKLFAEDDIENYLQLFSSKEQITERKNKIVKILKYCKLY